MLIFYQLYKLSVIFLLLTSIINCSEKKEYSGKIFNNEAINYQKFDNKSSILQELGHPSFIDPIEKKYYYYSQTKTIKNFFNQKIDNRNIIVFKFNDDNTINSVNEFDLNDQKDVAYIEETTPNAMIKNGLLRKIFGGVGKQTISNSQ